MEKGFDRMLRVTSFNGIARSAIEKQSLLKRALGLAVIAFAALGLLSVDQSGLHGVDSAAAKPRVWLGKCSTSVARVPGADQFQFSALEAAKTFEFQFAASCRTKYPSKEFYLSEFSLAMLLKGDNKTQKVLNAVGEEVGLIEASGETIGSCSIEGKYRSLGCAREDGTPIGRKFSVSFGLKLNKLLPRGCKDGGSAADKWDAAVTSGRRPHGGKGFTTYLLDNFEFPGCEPQPTEWGGISF